MSRFVGLVLVCCALAGCTQWETVRDEVSRPINQLIHRDYPSALKSADADRLASMHAPGVRGASREFHGALLGEFTRIDRTECVILRVVEHEDDELTIDCRVAICGVLKSGKRKVIEVEQRIVCARTDGRWEIASRDVIDNRGWVASGPTFRDEAARRGLAFTHTTRGVKDKTGQTFGYLPGSGLGVRDIDGDGYPDVVMVGGGDIRLFHNVEGKFTDETKARGIVTPEKGECRYAIFGDIDNDGDPDLFIGVLYGDHQLFRNDGTGHFTRVDAPKAGIPGPGNTTGGCFADFDGDGDLDLYIVNGENLMVKEPSPVYHAQNGHANQLLLNQGDWTFRDATEDAGVGSTGWALAVTPVDYDQDGDVDIFIANDFGPDELYRNNGDGTFDEVSKEIGIGNSGASMGATWGDVNGDGHLDLFVSQMQSNSRWILDLPSFPAPAPWPFSWLLRDRVISMMSEMFHGNRFYLNKGDGTFEEVSQETNTQLGGWAWGGLMLDYDNDGMLDIYLLNGLISGNDPFDC